MVVQVKILNSFRANTIYTSIQWKLEFYSEIYTSIKWKYNIKYFLPMNKPNQIEDAQHYECLLFIVIYLLSTQVKRGGRLGIHL